jgi:hypothetical protein
VRNPEKELPPRLNIERSPLFLLTSVLLSTLIVFCAYILLKNVNPWGFIVIIPGAILSFQTLWWILNPFALVFDDKIEIKQSLMHHKFRYFVDVKKITDSKKTALYLTYNDDEVELLNLFGIKPSQVQLLKSEMEKSVTESLKARL